MWDGGVMSVAVWWGGKVEVGVEGVEVQVVPPGYGSVQLLATHHSQVTSLPY